MRFFAYPPSANNDFQTCHARLNFTILIPPPPPVASGRRSQISKMTSSYKEFTTEELEKAAAKVLSKLNGIPTRQISCSLVTDAREEGRWVEAQVQ